MDYEQILNQIQDELGEDFDEDEAIAVIQKHPEWAEVLQEGEQSAVPSEEEAHLDSTGTLTVPMSKNVTQALIDATL